MSKSSSLIREDREFFASIDALSAQYRSAEPLPIVVGGLAGGAAYAYLSEAVIEALLLVRKDGGHSPIVVLCANPEVRDSVAAELSASGIDAMVYKMRDPVLYNISASHEIDRERLLVLSKILSGECECVVTTPDALVSFTMPREVLTASSLSLTVGDEMPPDELVKKLTSMGFRYVDAVEDRGQFSRRGGIVDLWCGNTDMPTRVEFFGDEVDRMVSFDPLTQRASSSVDGVSLLPSEEMVISPHSRERIGAVIDKLLESPKLTEEMRAKLERERAEVKSGLSLAFRDKYMEYIYPECESLIDYLGKKRIVFVIDTAGVRESLKKSEKKNMDDVKALASYGAILPSARMSFGEGALEAFLSKSTTLHQNTFAGGVGNIKLGGLFGFRTRRTVSYGDNPRLLFEDLLALRHGGYRTVILAAHKAGVDAVLSTLGEMNIAAVPYYDIEKLDIKALSPGQIAVTVGDGEGFELISPKIALISMARDKGRAIMREKQKRRVLKRVGGAGARLMSHADLSVGDYVVHASYGIGRFLGVEAVTVDGVTRDYITIQYAGTDRLFVPCDRLENIGKYIGEGASDGTVKLSRMGGTDWARTKSRAKAAAEDVAKKLIAIYAERQRLGGYAFPKKTELEDEFDAQFIYEETDSQLVAINEIAADMEKAVPMNRLLCGDVGFGKTEVALRAAFKAIVAGKQVALLVPTTILALQHYTTALARMRGYAVNIEMLSRFKKPKERAEILRRTERGEVDLLIGTHTLLSKNMHFKDLGLLIIDEEQRFGVMQKERLREMARGVDTLMLSATPIPRTLNMAMTGISDISILDEAPGERRPVQTYVLEHDEGLIHDAIRREMARGGQVLYLYNKVEDISFVADKLMVAIPDARIAYAHGQMDKEEFEDIWQELVEGEIDVLVCTTIVETGVDLPNANTLIIENADRYGLSQLHQIRGRVGRSERQAYAYFTYRPGKALSEVAEKRLAAVREFAEFGAGFKIALRDLEIRGAGNLLGREQHGYIESVGYDLYLKLLSEAVIEERGEARPDSFECQIVISRSAHIPEKYIPSSASRMEMYKIISSILSVEDKDEVLDEFIDRFGDIPPVVERLVNVSLARALGTRARVSKVEERDGRLIIHPESLKLDAWSEVFAKMPGLNFLGTTTPSVVWRLKHGEDSARVACEVLARYLVALEEN